MKYLIIIALLFALPVSAQVITTDPVPSYEIEVTVIEPSAPLPTDNCLGTCPVEPETAPEPQKTRHSSSGGYIKTGLTDAQFQVLIEWLIKLGWIK